MSSDRRIFYFLFADLKFINACKQRSDSSLNLFKSSLSPSFICTFIYRISHLFYLFKIPLFPRLFWWMNFLLFKVDLDHRAMLYSALYFPHPMMIVIGHEVVSHGALKIMQGVTIGGNLGRTEDVQGKEISQPVLRGRFFLGAQSLVLGPVVLEGRVFIAAQAVCSKSCNNCVVLGNGALTTLNEKYEREIY